MSRSRHVALEQAETAVLHGSAARRRAALEQELHAAYADGDRELVSRLRQQLADLEARGEE